MTTVTTTATVAVTTAVTDTTAELGVADLSQPAKK